MGDVDPRAFGALEAEVASLKEDIKDLRGELGATRSELKQVTELLHQLRGGWRITAGAFGVALAIGGLGAALWRSVR